MAGGKSADMEGIGNVLIWNAHYLVDRKHKVMDGMSFGKSNAHWLLYRWIHLSGNKKMVTLPEHLC